MTLKKCQLSLYSDPCHFPKRVVEPSDLLPWQPPNAPRSHLGSHVELPLDELEKVTLKRVDFFRSNTSNLAREEKRPTPNNKSQLPQGSRFLGPSKWLVSKGCEGSEFFIGGPRGRHWRVRSLRVAAK